MHQRPRLRSQGTLACALSLVLIAQLGAQDQEELPEDIRDVPAVRLHAPEDKAMDYFLIGGSGKDEERSKDQEAPLKLLLVLPGGDGSADFHPFIRRIWKHALSEDWLVAQLVAPQWSDDQAETLVWPTDKKEWPKMRFSTEAFAAAVIEDVERRYELDTAKIFTLSWSSGGPAAYAISLAKDSRVTGSFVGMSVFKPWQLPDLKAAEGHAYYLLHSPQDFIPIRMAEQAKEMLGKAKAKVHLETYEGGHRWPRNVYGSMRSGLSWLEENHAQPVKTKRKR